MSRRRPWWSVLRRADLPGQGRSPEVIAINEVDLRRAIARLPDDDKIALFTYFYLDLPLEEVARVLRIPLGTAKSRVYRAARRLRPGVAQEEVLDR